MVVDPRGERTDEQAPQIVMWRTLVKSECMRTEGQTNKDTRAFKSHVVEVSSWIEEQQCIWCLVGGGY